MCTTFRSTEKHRITGKTDYLQDRVARGVRLGHFMAALRSDDSCTGVMARLVRTI